MTAITEPPTSLQLGQVFNATYTIQNTGVESAQPSLTKILLEAAADLKAKTNDRAVGELVAGATFTDTLPLTVRPETVPGTYRFRVCADASTDDGAHLEKMTEKDESNNCKTSVGTVQVTPAPDLQVGKVRAGAPLTVKQDEILAIEVVVRNTGLLNAAASTLTFRLVSTGVPPVQINLNGTLAVPAVLAGTLK